MPNDVLIDFYLTSVKVQSHEYHLCGSNLPEDHASALFRETETVRRELGAAMCRLLHSALPCSTRNPRLFRTKYTEEVDLRNLEKCLVAAANKVVTFSTTMTPRDYDLRPAQPSAAKFLDILMQVQFLVSNLIELALAECDREALSTFSADSPPVEISTSAECARVPEVRRKSVGKNLTSDSFETKTAALRVRRQSRPSKDNALRSKTEKSEPDKSQPNSTCPQASTSQLDPNEEPIPIPAGTSVTLEVHIGPNIFHETVRLPPASKLVISDELCSLLRELDEAAAKFEFEFVRTLSRRLRTIQEAEDLQIMAVLFSETLMWGLAVRLFSVRQLADRDPTVLLSLPRLAILVGTRILPDSPIGAHRLAAGRRLPFMCNNSRTDLAYLARQLYALRLDQLFRLARWLGPRGLPNINRSRSTEPTGAGYSASGPAANNRLLSPSPDAVMHSCWRGSFSPLPVRRTWKANLAGLHRIYKTVATVADRLSVDFPTELRFILQAVIEMHDTSEQEAALAEETTVSRLSSSMKLDQSSSSTNFLSGAESSVVESVPSNYPSPSSSSSESSDTELEDELVVDEKALGSDPKHGSLAKLLDWSDVISHREPRKTRLTDLLRSSTVSALKFAKSEDSLMLTGMPHTDALEVRKKPMTMASPDSSSLELGVDVAAMLVGNEAQSSCEQIESRSRGLSELRSYLIESGDGSQTDNSIPNSVTHRLHKLQLGLSVEGVRTPTDRMYHYLPAWQPDRPRDSDRTLPGRMDSEEEDRESDSDDDYSHNDEDAVVYQVGRQCASCLRAFNLFRRRHHCRRCGHIFCASCSSHWQSVEGLATDKPVRICAECHEFLNVQNTA